MANPQKENGYVPFANELVEQFARLNLSAYEWRVLWVLWRKTWGWHKKQDKISLTQFELLTGLSRRHIKPILDKLLGKNMITREETIPITYAFQKNYELWLFSAQTGTSTQASTNEVLDRVLKSVPKHILTKDNKETKQKKRSSTSRFVPPTIEQIRQYCDERNNSVNPERFFDFYESKGWMIGKNKMKNWKAAVRTWEANNDSNKERSLYQEFKG